MSSRVPLPPPGFDELSPEERLDYVQRLWNEIATDAGEVPVPDWHREILEQRLARYRAKPDEGEAWPEVRDRLRSLLDGPSDT